MIKITIIFFQINILPRIFNNLAFKRQDIADDILPSKKFNTPIAKKLFGFIYVKIITNFVKSNGINIFIKFDIIIDYILKKK